MDNTEDLLKRILPLVWISSIASDAFLLLWTLRSSTYSVSAQGAYTTSCPQPAPHCILSLLHLLPASGQIDGAHCICQISLNQLKRGKEHSHLPVAHRDCRTVMGLPSSQCSNHGRVIQEEGEDEVMEVQNPGRKCPEPVQPCIPSAVT